MINLTSNFFLTRLLIRFKVVMIILCLFGYQVCSVYTHSNWIEGRGASEVEQRSLPIVNEDARRDCNKPENSSAKSILCPKSDPHPVTTTGKAS